MPLLVLIVFFNAVRTFVHTFTNKTKEVKSEPLCSECSYAHMQYGANAERVISCTYGGGVRRIKLDVLYCTDYLERNGCANPVRIGFMPLQTSSKES
jgi:hypothetical protein